jgi:hypothetical protein
MVALTIGISLGQARAVIEGAIGIRSSFVRTPKDGAIGRVRSSRPRRRARWRDYYLEALAAIAASLACACALAHGATLSVAALALFAIGWAWVALATMLDR